MTSLPKPVILCFIAYYLPGYRSGGPVRTISNFVERFGREFDIRIFTQDRDILDIGPYPGIEKNRWNQVGDSRVFYASKNMLTLYGINKILRENPYDILYLNSFFGFKFSALPLLVHRLRMIRSVKCILAPRGEFSEGAIALKSWKKRLYITWMKILRLHSCVQWQASSELEFRDIQREFNVENNSIFIAPNLPPQLRLDESLVCSRVTSHLRAVFISRISPKKNLYFLLKVFGALKSRVDLDIFGPIEDGRYWESCSKLLASSPRNVIINMRGEIEHSKVRSIVATYDLFVLPTLGENYGHVIFESLSAGTPVLISDHTPWTQDLDGAVRVLPLIEERWRSELELWATKTSEDMARLKLAALEYTRSYLDRSKAIDANRALFKRLTSFLESPN